MVLSKFGELSIKHPCGRGTHSKPETLVQQLHVFNAVKSSLWYLKFGICKSENRNLSWLCCGDDNGKLYLWNVFDDASLKNNAEFVIKDKSLPKVIRAVDFSRSGEVMVAAGSNGRVVCYKKV